MVVGFNHNFRYKGSLYHVQTEDGGLKNPQIVTLLFSGGTILASRKTSYADIVRVNNLEQVVEELMKEQHREMLRRLKDGELDDAIRERLGPGLSSAGASAPTKAHPPREPRPLQDSRPSPAPRPVAAQAPGETKPAPAAKPSTAEPKESPPPRRSQHEAETGTNLDDLILSYLTGDPGRKS